MRTITDIKTELTDAFMANENLQKAYGFALALLLTSSSAVFHSKVYFCIS